MRIYYRTGRRSGVSMGPIGWLVVGPFLLMYWVVVAGIVGLGLLVRMSAQVATWAIVEHRRRHPASPSITRPESK